LPEDLMRLQLAFTLHMAQQVLGSDQNVTETERSWLRDRFPAEMLAQTGFLDADGHLTAAFEEARDDALMVLPEQLPMAGKWQILEDLVQAAAADGILAAEESDALAHTARLLGMSDQDWADHVESLFAAGTLRRDGCGA
jgi:uncharacterized tellurite resistance protein B-like protein